ncbi:ABC transporter ATP-binding protein [Sorangium sp. So ce861]|uniref:ABC transporter ATP-binding protein n=1 Tax=Sorangium sp. So ce861 TaxID=3133323 RepID=UPI003F5DAA71
MTRHEAGRGAERVALELRGLRKTYPGGVVALDGVDLEVGPGLFGLLGPNGAGKSTLMRTLATLQRPDAGEARLSGVDMLRRPELVRRQLGYLPQEFGVYPEVSARALLDYLATLKGLVDRRARRRAVGELLERVNLSADADRPVSAFSGGMRQRFGIAQALLGSPRLVIVDEPTAGLDPAERNRFHHILAEIGEQAIVLLSTHIVEDVASVCTGMAIIARGRIVRRGPPRELCASLRGALWERSARRDEVPALAERLAVLHTRPSGGEIVVTVAADERPEGFAPKEPELEDLYHLSLKEASA